MEEGKGKEQTGQYFPDPPISQPLLVLYDTRDQLGVLRYFTTENDIPRAHLAVARLFNDSNVVRAWIVKGVQEFGRDDFEASTKAR